MANAVREPRPGGTRHHLIEVAVSLFLRHTYAGTSLQMIADRVGITKASIYHHFRTREDLLLAAVEPIEAEMRSVVAAAEAGRTPHARAERMVTGYASVAVRHRSLLAVLGGDAAVIDLLHHRPRFQELIDRQMRLLADVDPGPGGLIKAAAVYAGIAGAARIDVAELTDSDLFRELVGIGRRTLGLRTPRRFHPAPRGTAERNSVTVD